MAAAGVNGHVNSVPGLYRIYFLVAGPSVFASYAPSPRAKATAFGHEDGTACADCLGVGASSGHTPVSAFL